MGSRHYPRAAALEQSSQFPDQVGARPAETFPFPEMPGDSHYPDHPEYRDSGEGFPGWRCGKLRSHTEIVKFLEPYLAEPPPPPPSTLRGRAPKKNPRISAAVDQVQGVADASPSLAAAALLPTCPRRTPDIKPALTPRYQAAAAQKPSPPAKKAAPAKKRPIRKKRQTPAKPAARKSRKLIKTWLREEAKKKK